MVSDSKQRQKNNTFCRISTNNREQINSKDTVNKNFKKIIEKSTGKKKALLIVPGFSISYPPEIGNHKEYIKSLKYQSQINPFGYHSIHLFNPYNHGKKDYYEITLSQLTHNLWKRVLSLIEIWKEYGIKEIDIIGASMGGILVRKLLSLHLIKPNYLKTANASIKIRNVLLIATPNYGSKLVNLVLSAVGQFIIRLFFGKNNFTMYKHIQQLSVRKKLTKNRFKRNKKKHNFLSKLNSDNSTPGDIRYITLIGTKAKWYSPLIFGWKKPNDGVVAASSALLPGAENIHDYEIQETYGWNHRDLYEHPDVCQTIREILLYNFTKKDYKNKVNAINPDYLEAIQKSKKITKSHSVS
ncbi:MAG: hypothetical protein U9O98_05065 [Asgard group archaeon]|nr:hypothetical protein [Asgard group archaeon]